jgi:ribA/ribD-fused uncharacterized protein
MGLSGDPWLTYNGSKVGHPQGSLWGIIGGQRSIGSFDPMANVIHFYRVTDPFGCFSNFALFPIALEGKTWPTSEHYFQAQKFLGEDHSEAIRCEPSPMKAAKMGRDRTRPLRSDWEQVKDDIMRQAVFAKFSQHESLRKQLLDTGDAMLVEHTTNDAYWGNGGDGSGKNMLGRILMEVRERLRESP